MVKVNWHVYPDLNATHNVYTCMEISHDTPQIYTTFIYQLNMNFDVLKIYILYKSNKIVLNLVNKIENYLKLLNLNKLKEIETSL